MATSKAKKVVLEDLSGVAFQFAHGTEITVMIADLPEDTVANLICHGLSQKLGDSYSGAKDSEEAQSFLEKVLQRLKDGEWKAAREGGGGGRGVSQLVEALHRATGKPIEDCNATIDAMDDDAKKGLRAHPEIKAQLAQIKLEKAQEAAEKAAAESEDDEAPSLATLVS